MGRSGRPKKENVKKYECKVRLNEGEKRMLDVLVRVNNTSKSEIIRSAIRIMYMDYLDTDD